MAIEDLFDAGDAKYTVLWDSDKSPSTLLNTWFADFFDTYQNGVIWLYRERPVFIGKMMVRDGLHPSPGKEIAGTKREERFIGQWKVSSINNSIHPISLERYLKGIDCAYVQMISNEGVTNDVAFGVEKKEYGTKVGQYDFTQGVGVAPWDKLR